MRRRRSPRQPLRLTLTRQREPALLRQVQVMLHLVCQARAFASLSTEVTMDEANESEEVRAMADQLEVEGRRLFNVLLAFGQTDRLRLSELERELMGRYGTAGGAR